MPVKTGFTDSATEEIYFAHCIVAAVPGCFVGIVHIFGRFGFGFIVYSLSFIALPSVASAKDGLSFRFGFIALPSEASAEDGLLLCHITSPTKVKQILHSKGVF